jgi:hypothetical protein
MMSKKLSVYKICEAVQRSYERDFVLNQSFAKISQIFNRHKYQNLLSSFLTMKMFSDTKRIHESKDKEILHLREEIHRSKEKVKNDFLSDNSEPQEKNDVNLTINSNNLSSIKEDETQNIYK